MTSSNYMRATSTGGLRRRSLELAGLAMPYLDRRDLPNQIERVRILERLRGVLFA